MNEVVEIDQQTSADLRYIQACFEAQAEQALQLRKSSASSRIADLKKLRTSLIASRDSLYSAFDRDFKKPATEVELTEILPVLDEIRHAIRHLKGWMRPRRAGMTLTTLGGAGRVEYQPKGRCLIIGPWNYPVATVLGPLVSAVAAGNTVICKPSEFTPSVNEVVAALLAAAFAPERVSWITGGVAVATELLKLPFDHIFFTGSTAVGRIVMRAAAQHLTSITLELGGKSPVIVDQTADLRQAAAMTLWGKFINAGQSCIAPDYLFVHRSVHDRFVAECKTIINDRYLSTAASAERSPDLARMINTDNTLRVINLLTDALDTGATLLAGGEHNVERRYIAPTLLGDPAASSKIMQSEIFGPLLPILPFDDVNEVIARINAGPKPLALYIWSTQSRAVRKIMTEVSSGGVCVNHCMQHFTHSNLPFGGVNHSGLGSSHGVYGFKAFSHERAVLRGWPFIPTQLMFPPYTSAKHKLARLITSMLRLP